MINFRFHVVSLVAVFLALAVGVVMGYGVFSQPTFSGLQNRIDRVEERANQVRGENRDLRDAFGDSADAIAQSAPFVVTGRLTGVPQVVLAARGLDDGVVRNLVELLRTAGADVSGILWMEERWNLAAAADVAALGALVGEVSTRRSDVRAAAIEAMATRLGTGGVFAGRADLMGALETAGYLAFEAVGPSTAPPRLGGFATRVVLVVGSDAKVAPTLLVGPVAAAFAGLRAPLVIADLHRDGPNLPSRDEVLAPVFEDGELSRAVATVDDLDRPEGALAVVLATAELGRSVVGHYGVGDEASRALPEWTAR